MHRNKACKNVCFVSVWLILPQWNGSTTLNILIGLLETCVSKTFLPQINELNFIFATIFFCFCSCSYIIKKPSLLRKVWEAGRPWDVKGFFYVHVVVSSIRLYWSSWSFPALFPSLLIYFQCSLCFSQMCQHERYKYIFV